MPYIKQELRNSPDYIIGLVLNNEVVEALSLLSDYIKTVSLDKQDGTVNYIFTALFKNVHGYPTLSPVIIFIRGAISSIYLSIPSYFNFERLIGLLSCMYIEFCRRGWDNILIINDLLEGYEENLADYEDKKKEENGDL